VSFTPPQYPYARLDGLREVAQRHDGGVIDCSIGTPIDAPPEFVMEVLARGDDARGYPPSAGTVALREAATGWLARRFGVEVSADDLAACVGTKEFVGTVAGYLHLRRPELDTVLYPAISYPTYDMGARLAGLRAVPVPVQHGQLQLDAIEPDDARRALLLWSNSPSNPTGGIDDLAAAAQWGRDRGVLVVSDECYCEYTWDRAPASILQYGTEGVLALHSISKRSNLAGLRAGFYAGDHDVVSYLRLVRQHAGFMVSAPVQAAAAAAYGDDEHVDVQRARYHHRLELMAKALTSRAIHAAVPEGTFYLWIRREGYDGWELARELAEVAGLLTSPGEFYGDDGRDFVRVAMVQTDEKLALAANRLENG